MCQYYHATTLENAKNIEKNGFIASKNGMLGPAIYFAFKPRDALLKARCNNLNAIVVVRLNTGRIKTEKYAHNWDLKSLNNNGYDSVQMLHCRTGPEICLFEKHRITIIGIVHWDKTNIEFYEIDDHSMDMNDLFFLIEGRKLKISNSKKGTGIIISGCHFGPKFKIISKGGNNIQIRAS